MKKPAREESNSVSVNLTENNFQKFMDESLQVKKRIDLIQSRHLEIPWYPYDTLGNLEHLKPMSEVVDKLFAGTRRIADIGAADGHLAFCLEALGNSCDIYDNGPTNYNGLRGAKLLREELQSKVKIFERDLDSQFDLDGQYDLIIFLGILYHLKNPYYALETLSRHTKHLIISTRICRHFRSGSPDVSDIAAAYLLGPDESNGDATNYWIFTVSALRRIFDRTGWKILAERQLGDVTASNPQDDARDERYFAILERR